MLQVKGMAGSTPALLISLVGRRAAGKKRADRATTDPEEDATEPGTQTIPGETPPVSCVCIAPDEEAAAWLYGDLVQFTGPEEPVIRLPATGHTPYDEERLDDLGPLMTRADVLQQIADGFAGVIVTSIEALFEKTPAPETIRNKTIAIETGSLLSPTDLADRLVELGFERVEFVEQPGEVALRGGILDVYPFMGGYPIRAEFFGDEIDTIREFDPRSQRSVSRLTSARLVPNLERDPHDTTSYTSIFEHLPTPVLLATFDEGWLVEKTEVLHAQAEAAYLVVRQDDREYSPPSPKARYLSPQALKDTLLRYHRLQFGALTGKGTERPGQPETRSPATPAETILRFDSQPQPDFSGNVGLLRTRIQSNSDTGMDTWILCDSRGQEARLAELLDEDVEQGRVRFSVESLHEGFEIPSLGLAVYTDHQLFNRYHRPPTYGRRQHRGGLSLRDIQNIGPGDLIVHVDHGIGRFAGLERITVRGKQQEAVRVLFRDDDVLYVNVGSLYKLHKYTGGEGQRPRLTKLGSGQWERTKKRAKSKVKDIARDLIRLYAERKASKGIAFPADTVWQREMEAAFRYEDTPDQAAAAEAVKEDMEAPVPMDRLVCGDVGFGKTEIAIRAAFKAVQDGKQVAVLVPTSILAAQHHATFTKRLATYPVRVEMAARFRTSAMQKRILEEVEGGRIDILVGTHRLTSKDVRFKDLGLLIIDEEQRFGVSVKERLRALRKEVDTLTLTATPIPRTLRFSLLGARDLSIIATPPPNRRPVQTEIHTFDKRLVRSAILYETSRGGQVFFIHNRIRSIDEMAASLRLLVPDVRIDVAHGQMKARELEQIMDAFVNRRLDVLVSTNIVENGVDISNANTMIIHRADRFGLAELHQLRGRVGRSDRKAFCYLLVPSIHGLTRQARRRLQSIEELSDLGSGFNLAMRDMDIRGAGNLLGGEQSGFIEDVGFETYHRILDEAVHELRDEEFQDVLQETQVPRAPETIVDVEKDAYLPETYVTDPVERLNLYRRISESNSVESLNHIRLELADRFGARPTEAEHLLIAAEMKRLGQRLRLPRVLFKNERLFLYVPSQEEDPTFHERLFMGLLEALNNLGRRYVLKETAGGKLRAIVQNVPALSDAKGILEEIQPREAVEV